MMFLSFITILSPLSMFRPLWWPSIPGSCWQFLVPSTVIFFAIPWCQVRYIYAFGAQYHTLQPSPIIIFFAIVGFQVRNIYIICFWCRVPHPLAQSYRHLLCYSLVSGQKCIYIYVFGTQYLNLKHSATVIFFGIPWFQVINIGPSRVHAFLTSGTKACYFLSKQTQPAV